MIEVLNELEIYNYEHFSGIKRQVDIHREELTEIIAKTVCVAVFHDLQPNKLKNKIDEIALNMIDEIYKSEKYFQQQIDKLK